MRLLTSSLFAVAMLQLGAGCAHVPVSEQAKVSKPNMVFADTAVMSDKGALASQIEPGASATGGAQAAGCTSCK